MGTLITLNTKLMTLITFPLVGVLSIAISVSLCLSVYLFDCLSARISQKHVRSFVIAGRGPAYSGPQR